MAFIFYDTETTGTDLHFDQILQFAAILTNDDLEETDRFAIRSRLLPHVVPSPQAMNVTGVTAEQLENSADSTHYEMVDQIYQKLKKWEPAQFIGHNSITFDEILLRSAFYKCLLPVYLTNTNGNSRLDSLKMLRLASIYEADSINFPLNFNGTLGFKLDQLAPANGFNHANAHEAMSDVEATIFMCRKIRDEAPDTWSRSMRFSNKNSVLDFCDSEAVFGLTEFYYGRPYTYLLHQIGTNPNDGKEILAFDLTRDPRKLDSFSDKELQAQLSQRPKVVRRFRANALPGLVDGVDAHPHSKLAGLSFGEIEHRAASLTQNENLKSRLIENYLAIRTQYDDSPHVEENLYAGFPSRADQTRMEDFHKADWKDRYAIVQQLEDPRYRELGEQLIYIEEPQCLTLEQRLYWKAHFKNRLLGLGEPCDTLTLPDAIQQAEDLIAEVDGSKKDLLLGHRDRLVTQLEKCSYSSI